MKNNYIPFLNNLMINLLNMDNILEIKNDYIVEYGQQQETDIRNLEEDLIQENHTKEISQKTLRNIKKYSKPNNILINYNEQDQPVKTSYLSKIDSRASESLKSSIRSPIVNTNDTQESDIRSPIVNTNDTQESDIRSPIVNTNDTQESDIRSPIVNTNDTQESDIRSPIVNTNDTQESDIRSPIVNTNDTQESDIRSPIVNTNDTQESDIRSFANEPRVISIKQIENYLNKKTSGRIKPISSNPRYFIPSNKTKKDIKNALLFSSIIDPESSYEVFKIQKKIQQIPAYSEGGLISYSQSGETNLGLVGEIQPEQISSTPRGIKVNPSVDNKSNSLGIISDPSVVIASQQGIETPEYSSVKTKDFNTQQIKLGDGGFIPRNEKINLIEDLKKIFLEIPPIESAELPPNSDITYSKNEPFPIEFSNIRNINSMISDLFASRAFRRI